VSEAPAPRDSSVGQDRTDFHAWLTDEKKSAFAKYCDTAVGSRGILQVLKYELAFGLISPMPAALGYLLRKKAFPKMLGRAGRGILFGRNVIFRHPRRISIGDAVILDDNCVLDAKGNEEPGVRVGAGTMIGRNTSLSCKGGVIETGENCNIGANCMLISETRLTLGNNVLIAGMCYIIAGGTHGFDRTDVPVVQQPIVSKGGVTFEDNCWIGANVTVLDGVTIGRDSIVGAGAVVTRSIPEFAIAIGVPAKVVKLRKETELNRQAGP